MIWPNCGDDVRQLPKSWLWVPAFAGTTMTSVLLHAAQKLVRLRQAVREAGGVGAGAAAVGQFLPAHGLVASGGVLPGETDLGIEGGDIRQRGTGVLLQANAAAARHFR